MATKQKKPRKYGPALSNAQVRMAAESMLRNAICQYSHDNHNNIDRIRKAFNEMAMGWVAAMKANKNGHQST